MKKIFPWSITLAYWSWLTTELLLKNPWQFFGKKAVEAPLWNTATLGSKITTHVGTFVILAILLCWANASRSRSKLRFWMGMAVAYGGATELLQFFVPNRWPGWLDAGCDWTGISIGFGLFVLAQKLKPLSILFSRPSEVPSA